MHIYDCGTYMQWVWSLHQAINSSFTSLCAACHVKRPGKISTLWMLAVIKLVVLLLLQKYVFYIVKNSKRARRPYCQKASIIACTSTTCHKNYYISVEKVSLVVHSSYYWQLGLGLVDSFPIDQFFIDPTQIDHNVLKIQGRSIYHTQACMQLRMWVLSPPAGWRQHSLTTLATPTDSARMALGGSV